MLQAPVWDSCVIDERWYTPLHFPALAPESWLEWSNYKIDIDLALILPRTEVNRQFNLCSTVNSCRSYYLAFLNPFHRHYGQRHGRVTRVRRLNQLARHAFGIVHQDSNCLFSAENISRARVRFRSLVVRYRYSHHPVSMEVTLCRDWLKSSPHIWISLHLCLYTALTSNNYSQTLHQWLRVCLDALMMEASKFKPRQSNATNCDSDIPSKHVDFIVLSPFYFSINVCACNCWTRSW